MGIFHCTNTYETADGGGGGGKRVEDTMILLITLCELKDHILSTRKGLIF